MKYNKEANEFVFEMQQCLSCQGSGTIPEILPFPNYERPCYGKACHHCGSTTKLGHRYMPSGKMLECHRCEGKGRLMENEYDYAPKGILSEFDIKVYRGNILFHAFDPRFQLGMSCIYSCQDYGRAAKMSDQELIDNIKNKDAGLHQAVHFMNSETKEVCAFVGIFVGENGYLVRPMFKEI